jgi:hypothetical protein
MREWTVVMQESGSPATKQLVIREVKVNAAGSDGEYEVEKDGSKYLYESRPEYPWLILSDALDTLDLLGLI